ncbi:MAG: glycosyltransferase [Phycisphaerales bacterium]|nr:MAG: glycosyltransferase [Phycisphaerales bacterium]
MARVCFVTYEISPTLPGGAGVFIARAVQTLTACGHSVSILLVQPGDVVDRFRRDARAWKIRDDQLSITGIDEVSGEGVGEAVPELAWFARDSWRVWRGVTRLIERERPDVVEFHDFCGLGAFTLAARAFAGDDGGPVMAVRLHSSLRVLDQACGTRHFDENRRMAHALERRSCELADAVLAHTATCAMELRAMGWEIHKYRIMVSRVEAEKMAERRPARASDGAKGNGSTILYVGRMAPIKGVEDLVVASVELMREGAHEWRVRLVGGDEDDSPARGTYGEYLRSLIPMELGDRFEFVGRVPRSVIGDELARADVAVFPSRWESFGFAAHEALAAGVPVVVPRRAAFEELFEGVDGAWLYDGTVRGLMEAIGWARRGKGVAIGEGSRDTGGEGVGTVETPVPRGGVVQEFDGGGRGRERGEVREVSPDVEVSLPAVYERLVSMRHRMPERDAQHLSTTLVIVDHGDPELLARTIEAVGSQWVPGDGLYVVGTARAEEMPLLARDIGAGHVRDVRGNVISALNADVGDALAVLHAGDVPSPEWLGMCRNALEATPSAGFAVTWLTERDESGESRLVPVLLDTMPESWIFEQGTRPTRALVRVAAGRSLVDIFDHSLGVLAEIGVLWRAIEGLGRGVVLAESLIECPAAAWGPAPGWAVRSLITRYGGTMREDLAMVTAALSESAAMGRSEPAGDSTLAYRVAVADTLGGRTLAKLAWEKMVRRAKGQSPAS